MKNIFSDLANLNNCYGRLTVIKEVELYISPQGEKKRKVLCRCNCGNFKEIMLNNLKSGKTKSCGCLRKELTSKKFKKHGLGKHPLYQVWTNMKNRCYNLKATDYKYYGKRGIKVCDEWINDPEKFIEWCLNNEWKKGLEIDRENNDGNYEPDNCRFVDHGLNIRNTRLLQSTNTSGFRGVFWNKQIEKWMVQICINCKRKYLGCFNSLKLAALRYDAEVFILNDGRPMNFIERVQYEKCNGRIK